MAETEQLVVALEARIRDFERNFKKAARASNDNWRTIEHRGNRAARNLENIFSRSSSTVLRSINKLGGSFPKVLAGLSTAISVEAVRRYADAWTNASNKIVAAGVKIGNADTTTEAIADIAQRSRSDFEAVADLYARLTRSTKDFNASQRDVAKVTETVAKALKLSGASSAEAQSTLVQLGQGLGSGKLQGDELRSLLENAPVIARAISKEFGVAVGALKELGAEGALTAERVFKALKDAAPEIEEQFAKTTATTADALKSLEAAAIKYIGTSGAVNAGTKAIGAGINALAQNFGVLANGAAALGTVLAVRLVAQGLTPAATAILASTRAAAAAVPTLGALNVALTASVIRANAGALAMRGLSGALALVGGPAGAAILGIGAAALYFSSRAEEARRRSDAYAAALERLREQSEQAALAQLGLAEQLEKTAAKQFAAERNALNKQLAQTEADIAAFSDKAQKLLEQAAAYMRSKPMGRAAGADISELARQFKAGEISAEQLKESLFALANSNPRFQHLADGLSPLLSKLAGAIALTAELQSKLSGIADKQKKVVSDGLRKAIPNPTAGTTYDQDSGAVLRDPVIRELIGAGVARRAVVEAQADKTAKKIRDKYQELRKTILEEGGTIDPEALRRQAAQIVAATEGSRRGGRRAGSATRQRENAFERQSAATRRRIIELQMEAAAVGKSQLEAARAAEAFRLMEAAKKSNLAITPQLRSQVDALAAAYARSKVELDQARKQQEQARQQAEFFRSNLSAGISDLLVEAQSLDQVFRNLAKTIARAAIEAALFGKGPLGGLTGGAGILTAIIPGLKLADGGYVSGPGTGRSDSVPARLSNGEFVVNAQATADYRPLLEAINSGRVRGYRDGGLATARPISAPPLRRAGPSSTVVTINAPVKVEGSAGTPEQNRDLAEKLGKTMEKTMRGVVIDEIMNQKRSGNILDR